ncbi:MAG: hypothetical protein JOZ05_10820, partial [Acetobacteraceae bacterium]|nr:hypothetical protein [Acetobacteraceae bacterium]
MRRLLDPDYYLRANPDVAAAGMDPAEHYFAFGSKEGRRPNPYFDPDFYRRTYADVASAGTEPLAHYAATGAAEGRDPSPEFSTRFYCQAHAEVRASGLNPLEHYLQVGRAAGYARRPEPRSPDGSYVPTPGLLTFVSPLQIELNPDLAQKPHLNVLAPGLALPHMSGGPNTVVAFGYLLAARGIPVRLVSAALPPDADQAPFWAHARKLAGNLSRPRCISLVDWHDRSRPCAMGANDVFMATAWWTAQLAKYALRYTRQRRFVYLIQDHETLLYPASTQAALAEETYALDHLGVVNTRLVFDHLVANRVGRYADLHAAAEAVVFEPAVDPSLFHPEPADASRAPRRRRLLFYARPSYAPRNLFELGLAALQKAIFDGSLDPAHWDFYGIGEHFTPVDLGMGALLYPAPWRDLAGYARQMREADLLICLMMSPHPSYPPLEMAQCGRPVVTTTYAGKTSERLQALSPNIIAVPPTIDAVAQGIRQATSESHRA